METQCPIYETFWAFLSVLDPFPELPDMDMTLNAISHMTLFNEEAPIIASSSGHGSNASALGEDSNVDVDLNYMDKHIFYDM